EHQAQARARAAVRKIRRAADRAGAQAAAQNHLLRSPADFQPPPRSPLDSGARTAQSDRMVAPSSIAPSTAPAALHPVLQTLLSRPYPAIMGVLNVTPDSFSDGGMFLAPDRALTQARRMVAEGADIIDIGAESTRPYGAQPVSAEQEIERLRPVLGDLVFLGVPISIDSMKAKVAGYALQCGVAIVNDVWGLQRDDGMAELVAA